ncbi:MAG: hypothetical protein AAFZ15_07575 [Bacteroidota bacterium]
MKAIKRKFKTEISLKEITQIEDWWNKLSEENQQELEAYYLDEDKNQDEIVSIFLCGKFVEQEKRQYEKDIFWINHFYDYIISHELHMAVAKPLHVGGICSSNNLAEQSIRQGIFKAGYICPLKKKECIIENLLKREKGKSFELYLKFKVGDNSSLFSPTVNQ